MHKESALFYQLYIHNVYFQFPSKRSKAMQHTRAHTEHSGTINKLNSEYQTRQQKCTIVWIWLFIEAHTDNTFYSLSNHHTQSCESVISSNPLHVVSSQVILPIRMPARRKRSLFTPYISRFLNLEAYDLAALHNTSIVTLNCLLDQSNVSAPFKFTQQRKNETAIPRIMRTQAQCPRSYASGEERCSRIRTTWTCSIFFLIRRWLVIRSVFVIMYFDHWLRGQLSLFSGSIQC